MKYLYHIKVLLFLSISLYFNDSSYAQSYGLGFQGQGVEQDKRTSLDLNPNEQFQFKENFELSFDISFLPGHATYYGYIFRIIANNTNNIDFIYDNEANIFNLIIGDQFSKISFKINQSDLYNEWNKLEIRFDVKNNIITLRTKKDSYSQHFDLKNSSTYKFLFGANNYKKFSTADVPPMKIRNIAISENNVVRHNWPLNEKNGSKARDVITTYYGKVLYPKWLKADHYYWKLEKEFTVKGSASVAFDAEIERLYVTASDALYSYSLRKNVILDSVKYLSKLDGLNIGNHTILNNRDGKLHNFYVDQHFISSFNSHSRKWDKPFIPGFTSGYIQLNKFISSRQNTLFTFGGYGHHLYHNRVLAYHFDTQKWAEVKTRGDIFVPRYLAALGATKLGDTAYILGGYGSNSGRQMLNPKHQYDMIRFTVKDSSFKKLFEIHSKNNDFVFANSLVIEEKTKQYFGLIFPKLKSDANLQLIRGSLKRNDYEVVGDLIPYAFDDLRSFADLFYGEQSRKFLAVTSLRSADNETTKVSIYSLLAPPEGIDLTIAAAHNKHSWLWVILFPIIFLAFFGGAMIVFYQRQKKKSRQIEERVPLLETTLTSQKFRGPSIFLFGEVELIDTGGKEIINPFTKLTRELFICLLLQSIKWKKGVSAEKLNELFWFDKDERSASNNRSVNMAKLKIILDQLGHSAISRITGLYKIDIDYNSLYVDYHRYLEIVGNHQNELNKENIAELAEITQRGSFLSNCDYEWLDQLKSEVTNDIIDTYLRFLRSIKINGEAELSIRVADYIFHHDKVNEDAMMIKCKALAYLGKHSFAKLTYDNFKKEYKSIYLVEFEMDYHAVLS